MHFALRQAPLNNANSSCIGCGICVSVCPMDTLSFGVAKPHAALVQIGKAVPSVPA
jgi:ferredoxin